MSTDGRLGKLLGKKKKPDSVRSAGIDSVNERIAQGLRDENARLAKLLSQTTEASGGGKMTRRALQQALEDAGAVAVKMGLAREVGNRALRTNRAEGEAAQMRDDFEHIVAEIKDHVRALEAFEKALGPNTDITELKTRLRAYIEHAKSAQQQSIYARSDR